jgi:hypothetical protein
MDEARVGSRGWNCSGPAVQLLALLHRIMDARKRRNGGEQRIQEVNMHGRTCLAALASEMTNKWHSLDMFPEREDSLLSDEFVLASVCGGEVSCCGSGGASSSDCRGLMRRGTVSMWRLGRCRFLLPPRGRGGDRDAEKTNNDAWRPTVRRGQRPWPLR